MALKQWHQQLCESLKEQLEDDAAEELFLQVLMTNLEQAVEGTKHGGSRPGRAPNLYRERELGHQQIVRDYFSEQPTYDDSCFRKRYRMRRSLFLRVLDKVCAHDRYFLQKRDATGALGLSSLQKLTAALRMLTCGVANDEYCRLGESTAQECLKRFVRAIREIFGRRYARQPTRKDILKQLENNAQRGFPGMFASLDCMHYRWKNWEAQFQDKDTNRSIIFEAIADQSLWIWHAYFKLPEWKDDLSVLDRSPLVAKLLKGEAADINYVLNGKTYPQYYLLTDSTYPRWPIFVQTTNELHEIQDEKVEHFAKKQEAVMKDVEKALAVFQARFTAILNPCRKWSRDTIKDIFLACVILHNMIIEDEAGLNLEFLFDNRIGTNLRRGPSLDAYKQGTEEMENTDTYFTLRNDLMEHLWAVKGKRKAPSS